MSDTNHINKIISCIPLPPPHGGITNWYRIVQAEAEKNGYIFINVNTSPRGTVGGRSLFHRVFVQGFLMLKQHEEIKKMLRHHQDVRVAHLTTSGELALVRDILFLRLFGKKRVKTVYHLHFGRVPQIFEKKGLEYFLLKRALTLASGIIAIDPQTTETLKKHMPTEKIFYVPNPVQKVEEEISAESRSIVFVGNILPSKGIEELMQVWEALAAKYPEWVLTLVGCCEDTYRTQLESRYSMNRVNMMGYLPHEKAMDILSESAFLVLPSHTEGFPNVVLEAMMRAKAVIGSDVGAIAEILSDGCGIVIPPKDTDALRDAMENLIKHHKCCSEMGKQGRKKALSQYASDRIFKQYALVWARYGELEG